MDSIAKLHAASVHFPMALLCVASVAGLLYLFWQPKKELRILSWWSMGIGWLSGVVAVASGLLAQSGLPPQAPYRAVLNWHIGTGLAVLVIYGLLLYQQWLHRPRAKRQRNHQAEDAMAFLDNSTTRWWVTVLLVLGLLCVLASGWNGGTLVYDWGVNVQNPDSLRLNLPTSL